MTESNNKKLLAVFAHPDDELSCFGTLIALAAKGYVISILILTNGEKSATYSGNSRHTESKAAAENYGFIYLQEHFRDGNLQYDSSLISSIQDYMTRIEPHLVITHFPYNNPALGHHQDHVVSAAAAINCAFRVPSVKWTLQAEPIIHTQGFQPNFYFDITGFIEDKLKAVAFFETEKGKYFMAPDAFRTKGRYWAFQTYSDDRALNNYCEPFVIVKGTFSGLQ